MAMKKPKIDPKDYAKRLANAKKVVAKMDPAVKKEIERMYPSKKINTPSKKKVLPLTGEAAIKEYQRSISPKGMAEANAAAKKAIEKKYPGMFIPETRTKAGVKKVGKKK